jgi:hypothetical protein
MFTKILILLRPLYMKLKNVLNYEYIILFFFFIFKQFAFCLWVSILLKCKYQYFGVLPHLQKIYFGGWRKGWGWGGSAGGGVGALEGGSDFKADDKLTDQSESRTSLSLLNSHYHLSVWLRSQFDQSEIQTSLSLLNSYYHLSVLLRSQFDQSEIQTSLSLLNSYYHLSVLLRSQFDQSEIQTSLSLLNSILILIIICVLLLRSQQFSVNFCEDPDCTTIALHFDPRFGQNEVARNSFRNGGWENEEADGGMPFQSGKEFTVRFSVLNTTTIKVSASFSIVKG